MSEIDLRKVKIQPRESPPIPNREVTLTPAVQKPPKQGPIPQPNNLTIITTQGEEISTSCGYHSTPK